MPYYLVDEYPKLEYQASLHSAPRFPKHVSLLCYCSRPYSLTDRLPKPLLAARYFLPDLERDRLLPPVPLLELLSCLKPDYLAIPPPVAIILRSVPVEPEVPPAFPEQCFLHPLQKPHQLIQPPHQFHLLLVPCSAELESSWTLSLQTGHVPAQIRARLIVVPDICDHDPEYHYFPVMIARLCRNELR